MEMGNEKDLIHAFGVWGAPRLDNCIALLNNPPKTLPRSRPIQHIHAVGNIGFGEHLLQFYLFEYGEGSFRHYDQINIGSGAGVSIHP